MKTAIIIPARLASSRLPGKPLKLIGPEPMILHVCRRASETRGVDEIWVATDHQDIHQVVTNAGFRSVMTRPDHETGTDRLAEANSKIRADIVVNVQGDEPFIDPASIEKALIPFRQENGPDMTTLATRFTNPSDIDNPNFPKVVINSRSEAMYFSRSVIPFPRDKQSAGQSDYPFLKHIGLYAYRRQVLADLASLPAVPLEQTEKLEQLRALYYGYRIGVVEVASPGLSVDTPEDLESANHYYRMKESGKV